MTRALLCLFVIAWVSRSAIATEQEQDLLILEGQHIYTYDLPRLDEAFPDLTFPEFEMISTANRKGYRATWATFQNHLYLVGLEARVDGKRKQGLLRNNQIIAKRKFPLKVTLWSGKIVQTENSSSLDIETMKGTDILETTTIIVKDGAVTKTAITVTRNPGKPAGIRPE